MLYIFVSIYVFMTFKHMFSLNKKKKKKKKKKNPYKSRPRLCVYHNRYGKCPKSSNTLFLNILAKILLFTQLFLITFGGMANSVHPDQSGLGRHCLHMPFCQSLWCSKL